MGGWRDARLAALGGALVWAAVWIERPAVGPAAAWLPWLGWAAVAGLAGWQPFAALAPLARWSSALAFFSLAAAWDARGREDWLKATAAATLVLAAGDLASAAAFGTGAFMTGLMNAYYNYTAYALAGGTAACAAWLVHARAPRGAWRAAAAAAAALGALAIALARSRGAALGLLAAFWVWACRRWGRRAAAAGAALLALAGICWNAGLVPGTLLAFAQKKNRTYPEVRPQIWRVAVLAADEEPLLGVGPGSFLAAFQRRPVPARGGAARWTFFTDYAHSELLHAAAETGWVGCALWAAGLGLGLAAAARRAGEEPAREAAAAAAAAMTVQLLVDNMLQVPGLALLFFAALGAASARPAMRRPWPRAAAAAGGLLALVAWLPRAAAESSPVRAAALFPAEAGAYEDLAYAEQDAGRPELADRFWSEAQRRAPFDAAYPWRRAQIAAARGNWGAAAGLAANAVALEPGFLRARLLRVEALARLGRGGAARAELSDLRRLLAHPRLPGGPPYEQMIETLDRAELARVAALVRE
jgi:O-antigen ligase